MAMNAFYNNRTDGGKADATDSNGINKELILKKKEHLRTIFGLPNAPDQEINEEFDRRAKLLGLNIRMNFTNYALKQPFSFKEPSRFAFPERFAINEAYVKMALQYTPSDNADQGEAKQKNHDNWCILIKACSILRHPNPPNSITMLLLNDMIDDVQQAQKLFLRRDYSGIPTHLRENSEILAHLTEHPEMLADLREIPEFPSYLIRISDILTYLKKNPAILTHLRKKSETINHIRMTPGILTLLIELNTLLQNIRPSEPTIPVATGQQKLLGFKTPEQMAKFKEHFNQLFSLYLEQKSAIKELLYECLSSMFIYFLEQNLLQDRNLYLLNFQTVLLNHKTSPGKRVGDILVPPIFFHKTPGEIEKEKLTEERNEEEAAAAKPKKPRYTGDGFAKKVKETLKAQRIAREQQALAQRERLASEKKRQDRLAEESLRQSLIAQKKRLEEERQRQVRLAAERERQALLAAKGERQALLATETTEEYCCCTIV